jgi:hypothetical protein
MGAAQRRIRNFPRRRRDKSSAQDHTPSCSSQELDPAPRMFPSYYQSKAPFRHRRRRDKGTAGKLLRIFPSCRQSKALCPHRRCCDNRSVGDPPDTVARSRPDRLAVRCHSGSSKSGHHLAARKAPPAARACAHIPPAAPSPRRRSRGLALRRDSGSPANRTPRLEILRAAVAIVRGSARCGCKGRKSRPVLSENSSSGLRRPPDGSHATTRRWGFGEPQHQSAGSMPARLSLSKSVVRLMPRSSAARVLFPFAVRMARSMSTTSM